MIVSRTPLRVSFFGGGTDLGDFYSGGYGAVLSTTIDKYLYVTVKPHGALFDEPYRLNYSKTELVRSLEAIENEIGREALRLMGTPAPIYISTIADLPSGSGLGSSSAYAVGLVNALSALRGTRATPGDLAETACHLEIDILHKPIGKQDQYSAAFGGLNYIRFSADQGTSISPINIGHGQLANLFDHFQLFWTGVTRQAESILHEQKRNTRDRRSYLRDMLKLADDAARLIREDRLDVAGFGGMLDEGWRLKRELASAISNTGIDEWYRRACAAGAYGGKLCGAGGGGFLLFCSPRERHESVRAALSDLTEIPIRYEPAGSSILYPTAHNFAHLPINLIRPATGLASERQKESVGIS